VTTLATVAPYSTGTVTSSGAVVTLATGTWPSWAATHGTLTVDSTDYAITSRDSDAQLTLATAPTTAFAADTFSLGHDGNYDLPDDFGTIEGKFTFAEDAATMMNATGVDIVGEGLVRGKRQHSVADSFPRLAAVRCKAATGLAGQRFEVLFWPVPDAAYTLTYRYTSIPGKLTAALPYPLGGALHAETVKASCMAAAEQAIKGERGVMFAQYIERLMASVSLDQSATTPTSFGYNGDASDRHEYSAGSDRSNYVTYNGTLYE
jgi:hypothetical protein